MRMLGYVDPEILIVFHDQWPSINELTIDLTKYTSKKELFYVGLIVIDPIYFLDLKFIQSIL